VNNTPADSLSRDKIKQLLAAIGSRPAEDVAQPETAEYDWHQPHYFSSKQLNKLNSFAKKIAEIMSSKFAKLYRSDINVTVNSTTQHYGGKLPDKVLSSGQKNYYLAFGSDQKNTFGFICVSGKTADDWVTELLGDAGVKKDEKTPDPQEHKDEPLSQLEESLLYDIASAVVESLAVSLRQISTDYDTQPAETVVRGRLPIELNSAEEVCVIVFGIEKAVSDVENKSAEKKSTEVSFLIPCSKLLHHWSIIGDTKESGKKLSSDDISKVILEHIKQMPVTVTANLDTTMLNFEQIMSLSPCDILLLNKTISEPLEIIVEGRAVFRGQLAKSSGQQAAVITELLIQDST
jgi:flagellar motor switch protein FliM